MLWDFRLKYGIAPFLELWLREYETTRRMEPKLRRDMEKLAGRYGFKLECLESSVKTPDAFLEKCLRKMEEGEASWEVSDAVRFTVLCGKEGPMETAKEVTEGLRKAGYLIYEVDDKFAHPTNCGYMGIHIHAIAHGGGRFEVQVHTPESLSARERTHHMYEIARQAETGHRERAKFVGRMQNIYKNVPLPFEHSSSSKKGAVNAI